MGAFFVRTSNWTRFGVAVKMRCMKQAQSDLRPWPKETRAQRFKRLAPHVALWALVAVLLFTDNPMGRLVADIAGGILTGQPMPSPNF